MTIGLSYNDDISRVQVSVTGLPFSTGTIRIERSTNSLYWETVRGAAELPVSGGAAAVDDYEFSPDVENTYRVVPVDPVAGLHLDGAPGSYAETPDHADLRVTGDIVLTTVARLDQWSGAGSTQALLSRYDAAGGQRSYQHTVLDGGAARMSWSTNGTSASSLTSSVPTGAADGDLLAIRSWLDVDLGGDHRILFYTSPDGEEGTWSQLGAAQDGSGTTSIHPGTAVLRVGVASDGAIPAAGVVHRAHVWSGGLSIGDLNIGTTVADPRFDEQTMGATSFTDSTGKLWTVNGDAYLVGTETNSITPSLDGKVWLKSIRYPFLNRWIEVVDWSEIGRATRGALHEVQGRSVPVAVTGIRASRAFTLQIATRDFLDDSFDPLTEARDLDLILASGDVFFVHVPAGLPVPGGYVSIGDTAQAPIASRRVGIDTETFSLPCRVVAKPGPGVVGGTMTYGALLNLYGGYQNLLAANSTYADVLALMASPEDLVVL